MRACGCGAVLLHGGRVRCAPCGREAARVADARSRGRQPAAPRPTTRGLTAAARASGIPYGTLQRRVQQKRMSVTEAVAMGPARRRAA